MTCVCVRLIGGLALLGMILGGRAAAQQTAPPQVQPQIQRTEPAVPAFRSRVTLVPLDVRVIDRDGKPVTDLTKDDFSVVDGGERQTVVHFSTSALVPEPPAATSDRPDFRSAPGDQLAPQRGRTFLLIIGRGRIQQPFDGIGSLIDFARQRLLPQDRAAVMAYNRMTDFTTDCEQIVAMLQRIRDGHERIEALLRQYESGLAPRYAKCKSCLPAFIVDPVKRLFVWPGAVVSREMPQALGEDDEVYRGPERRFYDALLETELAATRGSHTLADDAAQRRAELLGLTSSSDYLASRVFTSQDADKLLNGIREMRYFEGEKHILFLAERGLALSSVDEDRSIARAASDARIALHTVVTGGIPGPDMVGRVSSGAPREGPTDMSLPVHDPVNLTPWMVMRNLAEWSGGTASIAEYPREAYARVDAVTRFEYLLGYYPTSAHRDGKFRNVKVSVNRPDVRVLVRGGYYDEDLIVPGDRAAFLAHQRIATVGNTRDLVTDLAVTVKASQAKASASGAPAEVAVDLRIDPARVRLERVGDRHVGALQFRIYCGDPKEKVVGELHGTMDLKFTDEGLRRFSKDGIRYTAKVRVKAAAKTVKVIVYDPGSDLAGSAVARVR